MKGNGIYVILPSAQEPLFKIAKRTFKDTEAILVEFSSKSHLKDIIKELKIYTKENLIKKVIIAIGPNEISTQMIYDRLKKTFKRMTYIVMNGWKIRTRRKDIMVLLPGKDPTKLFEPYL